MGSSWDGAGRCGFCCPVHISLGPSPQMQLLERENKGITLLTPTEGSTQIPAMEMREKKPLRECG